MVEVMVLVALVVLVAVVVHGVCVNHLFGRLASDAGQPIRQHQIGVRALPTYSLHWPCATPRRCPT